MAKDRARWATLFSCLSHHGDIIVRMRSVVLTDHVEAVSDHAVALSLAWLRGVTARDREVRAYQEVARDLAGQVPRHACNEPRTVEHRA